MCMFCLNICFHSHQVSFLFLGVYVNSNIRYLLQVSSYIVYLWITYINFTATNAILSQIARFMEPTWGPSGADRTRMGPMLAPWTFLTGILFSSDNNSSILTVHMRGGLLTCPVKLDQGISWATMRSMGVGSCGASFSGKYFTRSPQVVSLYITLWIDTGYH